MLKLPISSAWFDIRSVNYGFGPLWGGRGVKNWAKVDYVICAGSLMYLLTIQLVLYTLLVLMGGCLAGLYDINTIKAHTADGADIGNIVF